MRDIKEENARETLWDEVKEGCIQDAPEAARIRAFREEKGEGGEGESYERRRECESRGAPRE